MKEFRIFPEDKDRLSREITKFCNGNMYHDWYNCRVSHEGLNINAVNCVESIGFFIPKDSMSNYMAKKLYR